MTRDLAVVTGATSGIGRAIAERLLRDGWVVVAVGRRPERLAELEGALALVVDVRDADAPERALALAAPQPGDRLLLINAAGETGPIGPVGEVDVEWMRSAYATNLLAPIAFTECFVPVMVRLGWGRVVNVSSASAFHPPAAIVSTYSTSKVALNFYTRSVAEQLAGTEVAAVAIHPGDVRTEIWDSIAGQSGAIGAAGAALHLAAKRILSDGGDDPALAADLIERIIAQSAESVNGRFLWIEGGLQEPFDGF